MPPSLRFSSIRSGLGLKFALLLAASLAGILAAFWLVQRLQDRAMRELLASEIRERSDLMLQVINLTSQPVRDFVDDYAQWDDMVRFVARPERAWASINLDVSLESLGVSALWVLRPDGSVVYATSGEGSRRAPALPLAAADLRSLLKQPPEEAFFLHGPGGVVELHLAAVQPSADSNRLNPPPGWLLIEKPWNITHVRRLARLLDCDARLAPPGQPLPASSAFEFTLRHPLLGSAGRPVADLVYTIRSREVEIATRGSRSTLFVLGVSGLAMVAGAVAALYFWVLRPVRALGDSLAHNDPAQIERLVRQSDEMGRLARVVETSFAQRNELERILAERARLGRELHDGVIQTIYATGMTLAGVRKSLRTDPAGAERILEDTRTALNSSLGELRAFINGLEPEPTSPVRFDESVRSILALQQGVRPIGFAVQIDHVLAEQLSPEVRLHLLQIIREAASNCVRHSAARTLEIVLSREAGAVALEISDDGDGIKTFSAQGQGLGNLAERSRELGGTLRIISNPGTGLRLHLVFPHDPDQPA